MAREGTRAAATLYLEARALQRDLDASSDKDDSENEWEHPRFLHELVTARYWYRSSVAKIAKWTPGRIFTLDSSRARRELRISVEGFVFLLQLVEGHQIFERKPKKQPQAPVQLQLEVFLYSLHSYTYHAIAQHYGIGEGSVRKFCDRVMTAVLSLERRFVRWPNSTEKRDIMEHVRLLNGFNGAVGFLDGTTFKLKYAPPEDPECYFSRKSDYCFNAQIVCDHRRRVTYYQVGLPGSVHDKRALSFSSMSTNPAKFFEQGEYLLGDSAYGVCFPFIVTPYKRPAALVRENARFNYLLAGARIAVEHCIGIMKGRFPVLSQYGVHLAEKGALLRYCNLQRVCFTLHNLCIDLNERELDVVDEGDESDDDQEDDSVLDQGGMFSSEDLRIMVHHGISLQ